MTNEEARVHLNMLWVLTKNPIMCDAIAVAQLANEKQIARKPIRDMFARCPSCKRIVRNIDLSEWCSHCGQHIDWSEE